jgi:hypothetical protein
MVPSFLMPKNHSTISMAVMIFLPSRPGNCTSDNENMNRVKAFRPKPVPGFWDMCIRNPHLRDVVFVLVAIAVYLFVVLY